MPKKPARAKHPKKDLTAETRKKRVFRAIVREYVRTAEPVASGGLAVRYRFSVSSATVRNDMAELEAEGLLEQPHTSAGRVPTEKGYRFYVEEFADFSELPERERRRVAGSLEAPTAGAEASSKPFARSLADLADQTVIMGFPSGIYLMGVANLTRQPEMREESLLSAVSQAIDDLDQVVGELSRRVGADIEVFIGGDNPFGDHLSSVVARLDAPDLGEGLIGILGPTRMDYDANVALLRFIREMLSRR